MTFPAFLASAGGQAAIQGGFSIGGNLFSAREAKKANRRNVKLYRENRDWEEMMANTEWQRGIADMLAAGVNPMAAYANAGASTPSVNAPTVEPVAQGSAVMESVAKNPQALLAMAQAAANVRLTNANAFKVEKEGNRTAFENNPEIMGSDWDRKVRLINAQIANEEQKHEMTAAEIEQIRQMLPVAIELEKSRRRLTDEQSTSAAQTRRLESYNEEELKTTAKWFREMGASGRVLDFINRAIMLLGK